MKIISSEQIASFRHFVDTHDSFVVAGHKEPDGDCVASCLGLSYILEGFGKPFVMVNAGPFKRSEIKHFAPLFTKTLPFMTQQERQHCGLLMTDCSELYRLGEIEGDISDLDRFAVDHHKTSVPDSEHSIVDATAPAASLLVLQLFEAMGFELSKERAETFFFGMATDSGFFKFLTEDSGEVFRLTAKLVEAGASPRKIHRDISSGKPWTTRKLLGVLLDKAERKLSGKLVITSETMDDTKRLGQEGRDSDAFYSLMLAVEGVEAVAFFRQESEFSCTLGLRSRDSCDVSEIAARFGGGGHKNAAGASCEGRLEVLIPRVVKEFAKVL